MITEFVSQFLDRERAFKEFARFLRPRAYVGINEMYREKEIPAKAAKEIDQAEKIIGEITGLPFSLLPPEKWKEELQRAGLKDVNVRIYKHIWYLQETKYMAEAMGGTWSFVEYLIDTILKMTKYYLLSKKIRYRFKRLEESKKSSSEKINLKICGLRIRYGKKISFFLEKNIKDQLKSSAVMLREIPLKFFWREKEFLLTQTAF